MVPTLGLSRTGKGSRSGRHCCRAELLAVAFKEAGGVEDQYTEGPSSGLAVGELMREFPDALLTPYAVSRPDIASKTKPIGTDLT